MKSKTPSMPYRQIMMHEMLQTTRICRNLVCYIISEYKTTGTISRCYFMFKTSRGLSFQGDNSTISDVHNGNFLGVLEILGKYDKINLEHFTVVN